jgi:hypothetical protein
MRASLVQESDDFFAQGFEMKFGGFALLLHDYKFIAELRTNM